MPTDADLFGRCAHPVRDRARAARARSAPSLMRPDPAVIRRRSAGTAVASQERMDASFDRDRFRPSPAVKASISTDGLVLLDVDGGLVLASNPVGARIWQLLAERRSSTEIARNLAGEYAIALDRAERDVATFVAALLARGLVTTDGRP